MDRNIVKEMRMIKCQTLLIDPQYPEFNQNTDGMSEDEKREAGIEIYNQIFDKYEKNNDHESIPKKYLNLWSTDFYDGMMTRSMEKYL